MRIVYLYVLMFDLTVLKATDGQPCGGECETKNSKLNETPLTEPHASYSRLYTVYSNKYKPPIFVQYLTTC